MTETALSHVVGAKRGSRLIKYDEVGDNYDRFRQPIGIPLLTKMLLQGFGELGKLGGADLEHDIVGASFCCGTGANELELLRELERVDRAHGHLLHLFDGSDRMLAQARQKLERLHVYAGAHQLDVVDEEYGLERPLDWASVIQAIHHFDQNDPTFPRMQRFFRRVRATMAPSASFLVVTSTPEQACLPRWYLNIMSGKVEPERDPAHIYSREFPTQELVIHHLSQAGFAVRQVELLSGPYITEEAHDGRNPEILFDPTFRDAESVFSIAGRFGLTEAFDTELRRLIRTGEIQAHRERSERVREKIGVAYAVRAVAI